MWPYRSKHLKKMEVLIVVVLVVLTVVMTVTGTVFSWVSLDLNCASLSERLFFRGKKSRTYFPVGLHGRESA